MRIIVLALLPVLANAQNPQSEAGYQHFYNLEFEDALKDFQAEISAHPDSPSGYNHVAHTILYREMFRSGALESEIVTGTNPFLTRSGLKSSSEEEKQFADSIGRALMLEDTRLKTNPDDTQALYEQGVTYGLRANYSFLVKKAWSDALRDATSARKAHARATEIDPHFIDARLLQGVYDYVTGSLPVGWRMLGFLAGFHGDRERGIATLKLVADEGKNNRDDAAVLLCAVLRREHRSGQTVPYVKALIQKYPRNFLLRLELANMYGEAGDKNNALQAVNLVDQLKRTHTPGFAPLAEEKIRYTRGNILFWYRELDPAIEDLKAATANAAALDPNTSVFAWLRLGQTYDMKGQRRFALNAYLQTLVVASESDAAKEAQSYMFSRYKR